jgi:hypothetical protein
MSLLSPGQSLGPYEVLSALGAGGMGEVYRARDTRLGREVAVKVSAQRFTERFEREARAIASLNHPNICTLHDVGPNYLVMELVEGPTLADRIQKGAIPLDETLTIARQIAEALEAAHAKNIVHRDLKPGNIKIKPDGTVKVLDFGLAKVGGTPTVPSENSPTVSMGATQAGVILGTAAYMSPEQARGKPVDKRADIWAFGVVLYEMLTGRRLFKGDDISEVLASVIKDEPRFNDVPVNVRRLLKKCLEKDPKRRLPDIADAWGLLDDSPPLSKLGIAALAAAGVLAIALAAALWALYRVPPPPDRPLMRLLVDLGTDSAFSGSTDPLTISPDGRRLVVYQTGKLWLRQLDQPQSIALAGTAGASYPFFSPDGLWIGFARATKLWKVSVQGGAPVAICDAPEFRGADWGPDGYIVAALNRVGGLMRVPENGGTPEPFTHADPQGDATSHRFPQVLPNRAGVLFTGGVGFDPNSNQIYAQAPKGQPKLLWKGGTRGRYLPTGHLVFVNQSTLYAAPMNLDRLELTGQPQPVLENVALAPGTDNAWYDFTRSGTLVFIPSQAAEIKRSIVRLAPGATSGPVLFPGLGMYLEARLSPDGKRVLANWEQNSSADQWVSDLARDAPAKLPFGRFYLTKPQWSPDGRYVFSQTRAGKGEGIAAVRADGVGEVTQLLEQRPIMDGFSFSPDGKTMVYAEAGTGTGYDLWTLPIDLTGAAPKKTGEPQVFLRTPQTETAPAISPDGRWIAYVSNESGRNEVQVRPFPIGREGGKALASTGGGSRPAWSSNRRDLLYRNPAGQIMATPYTVSGDVFSPGKPQLWSSTTVEEFDVAPDGKSVAAILDPPAADKPAPAEAVFLLNFFDELRRRVPAK